MVCDYGLCYEELPICSFCISHVQEAVTDRCEVCNKTANRCDCSTNEARHAFYYEGYFPRLIIRALKTRMDVTAADFVCELAINCCGLCMGTFDGVAFVPRHKHNLRMYGYDQAEYLALCISQKYGLDMLYAIERVGGREQKLLSHAERLKNIRNKYRIRDDFHGENLYRKVLLIDDIYTTGATVRVCADLLRKNIAKAVIPLTLSKTNHQTGS